MHFLASVGHAFLPFCAVRIRGIRILWPGTVRLAAAARWPEASTSIEKKNAPTVPVLCAELCTEYAELSTLSFRHYVRRRKTQTAQLKCHARCSLRILAALWGLAEGSMNVYVAGLHGQDHPYTGGKHALLCATGAPLPCLLGMWHVVRMCM